jgi:hypothetical protein
MQSSLHKTEVYTNIPRRYCSSVPDHRNEASHMHFLVSQCIEKLCLHCTVVKRAIVLCLKNARTLIKNNLLLKNSNHYLNSQRAVIFLLMESLASMLMAAD